jgi:transposase
MIPHQPYPSDVSDAEWAFVVPYLGLLAEDAGPRVHGLRVAVDGLRWSVRTGSPWRSLPKDFPPWEAVYPPSRRWLAAGCFAAIVHDLRALLRRAAGRGRGPTAAVFDSRTLRSTVASGGRAGDDGHKRKRGAKVPRAVDTLGHLLAPHVTPANEQDRAQVAVLAEAVQEATGESVEWADVDQASTGEDAECDAASYGIELEVVGLPEATRGFVLLPRRWVGERSFAGMARFRRLARDYQRLDETLKGLHDVAFRMRMLRRPASQSLV